MQLEILSEENHIKVSITLWILLMGFIMYTGFLNLQAFIYMIFGVFIFHLLNKWIFRRSRKMNKKTQILVCDPQTFEECKKEEDKEVSDN